MMPATVMTVTFVLTMIIPLQNAVLVGVGISMILYIIKQSNQITLKRWIPDGAGNMREDDSPEMLGTDEIVVLQPYGSLFFAAAPVFEDLLPDVADGTANSVVILRLRGRTDLGSTFMDVLRRYAEELDGASSKLVIISADRRIHEQLAVTRVTEVVGSENIYTSDEWVGATLKRAYTDANEWVGTQGLEDQDPTT